MEKAILFGAGLRYHQYRDELHDEFDVVALMDNDQRKIGTTIGDTKVISPEEATLYNFERIVVTTSAPICDEIVGQLIELGFPSEKILSYRNEKTNILSNGNYDIICIGNQDAPYFVVLDGNYKEGTSYSVRTGDSGVDRKLVAMFPSAGFFLDLGANIGLFSLYYASNGWRGHAFEASTAYAELLRKSIMLNDFDIRLSAAAVSDHTGNVSFMPDREVGFIVTDSNVNASDSRKVTEISCIALDDIMEQSFSDVEMIDLIKIDIEGSEVAALRGMKRLLSKYKYPPIYIELNAYALFQQNESPISLLNEAYEHGYTAYEIIDANTVCMYQKVHFQRSFTLDVILFKELPAHISVVKGSYSDNEETAEWILSKLKAYENRLIYEGYILYLLKNFPEYYLEPRINSELKRIALSKNDPITDKAIEWFRRELL